MNGDRDAVLAVITVDTTQPVMKHTKKAAYARRSWLTREHDGGEWCLDSALRFSDYYESQL